MAGYEARDNTGTLWKNDRRTTDNHPNAKGDCLIDGKWYWVSAWTKRKQDGSPFQSLSFTPKDDRPAQQPTDQRMDADNRASMAAQAPSDFDSEIPF